MSEADGDPFLKSRSLNASPLIISILAYFQDDASENNTGEIVKLSTQNLEVSKKICTFAPSNI